MHHSFNPVFNLVDMVVVRMKISNGVYRHMGTKRKQYSRDQLRILAKMYLKAVFKNQFLVIS